MPAIVPVEASALPSSTSTWRLRARSSLALIAAAWLAIVTLHWVRADVVSALLVVGVLASVMRYGSGLLDRIIVAVALVLGAGCGVGLLWSVWPSRLEPVAIAGTALTVMIVSTAAAGRRPKMPPLNASDLLALAGALVVTAVLATPYLRADGFTTRLALVMAGEDNARHLAMFDAIRHVGGYPFVDPPAYRETLHAPFVSYPTGWHLNAATLDGFLRSSAGEYGTGASALDHYVLWLLATFGFLILVVVWAALRIAGRRLRFGHRVLVVAAVTTLCLATELPRLLVSGYPSEMLGLALMVVLVVILTRPAPSTREQLLLIAALVVGIGFSYHFFLPAAVLCVLAAMRRRLRRLRRHPRALIVATLSTMVLAPICLVIGVVSDFHGGLVFGTPVPRDYRLFLVLACVVGAGLLSRAGLRSPTWRQYGELLAMVVLLPASVYLASVARGAAPAYYYGKALHLLLVVLLAGIAAPALLGPPPRPAPAHRGVLRSVAPTLLLVVAVVLVLSRLPADARVPGPSGSWTRAWLSGDFRRDEQALAVATLYERGPDGDATVVLLDRSTLAGYQSTIFLSALRRNGGGRTAAAAYDLPWEQRERIQAILERVPGPIQFVLTTLSVERTLHGVLEERPDWRDRVSIMRLPVTP